MVIKLLDRETESSSLSTLLELLLVEMKSQKQAVVAEITDSSFLLFGKPMPVKKKWLCGKHTVETLLLIKVSF